MFAVTTLVLICIAYFSNFSNAFSVLGTSKRRFSTKPLSLAQTMSQKDNLLPVTVLSGISVMLMTTYSPAEIPLMTGF
jgi:hypothetical protein